MARLTWDNTSERLYETGVKNTVLYVQGTSGAYEQGVAWNGITAVTESPSGAEESPLYADNIKYLSLRSIEEYGGTIEAYMYPDEWMECDGSAMPYEGVILGQQVRRSFGLCFRTEIGNDTEYENYGYKLHLIYNASVSPSERAYQTINDSPEAITFSWEFTTTSVNVSDINGKSYKAVSCITIDSTKVDKQKLAALEAKLYGDAENEATLPDVNEVLAMFAA